MKDTIILILVIFCFTACMNHNKDSAGVSLPVTRIDFSDINQNGKGSFGDYFDIVKVIKLETDSLSLLSGVTSVSILDSSLFVFDKRYSCVKVFDLHGKYKYSIGKLGQGEGEFTSLNDFYLNKEEKTVYLYSNSARGILKYSIQGRFINKITTPFFAYYVVPLGDKNIVYYVNYNTSKESKQNNLVFANYDGDITKFWAPYKNPETNAFSFTGYISQNPEGVLFGKAFNDTLYQISKDNTIQAKYHLNFDVEKSKDWESLPKEKLNFETTRDWTVLESGFLETNNLLAFTLDSKTRISKYFYFKNDKELLSEKYFDKKSLIKFLNQSRSSDGDVLISSVNADYFLAMRDQNPELLKFIKNENIEAFNILSDLDEKDNPVIILYKRKKK